jgi:nicotinamidase-related amidase
MPKRTDMDPTRLALLLVDIQRDFWQPLEHERRFTEFPANVRGLLRTARENRLPVVHAQSAFQPNGSDWMLFYRGHGRGTIPCIAGTDGVVVEDFAAPAAEEPVIVKKTFDGFLGTDLEEVLRSRRVQALLIAGLVTSVCVLFTATAAYLRHMVPIVVSDACADTPEHHDAALRMYHGLCFQSVTTAQVQTDLCSVVAMAEGFVASGG